jgi:hypothetical protein
MRQFTEEHPEIDKQWFKSSNYIVLLSVENEEALENLIAIASIKNVRLAIFREPDIGDQITAIAFEPGEQSRRLCSRLKLALNETK